MIWKPSVGVDKVRKARKLSFEPVKVCVREADGNNGGGRYADPEGDVLKDVGTGRWHHVPRHIGVRL